MHHFDVETAVIKILLNYYVLLALSSSNGAIIIKLILYSYDASKWIYALMSIYVLFVCYIANVLEHWEQLPIICAMMKNKGHMYMLDLIFLN